MQTGIYSLYGVLDYLKTGEMTIESDIGLGIIWKYMMTSIKRAEAGI